MPYDPELVAETRSWFVKATQDLGAATHEFTADPPFSLILFSMLTGRGQDF